MPMPATTTGIIHIEIDCAPANSNDVVSIGIDIPPIGTSFTNVKPVTALNPK